ncbi:hypothetical protein B0I37DRAFT_369107 [Chaetomium sp. MPI-CAGE-AT-0009]|nr:hypothetical protein B0I37DRAFT_369107 [Chaetomium sp. MPI-CAGE-AT-0009]
MSSFTPTPIPLILPVFSQGSVCFHIHRDEAYCVDTRFTTRKQVRGCSGAERHRRHLPLSSRGTFSPQTLVWPPEVQWPCRTGTLVCCSGHHCGCWLSMLGASLARCFAGRDPVRVPGPEGWRGDMAGASYQSRRRRSVSCWRW